MGFSINIANIGVQYRLIGHISDIDQQVSQDTILPILLTMISRLGW